MFKKKFLKTKCKVTFELPDGIEGAKDAHRVFLVGDFNEWDETNLPMERAEKKVGKEKIARFSLTVDLDLNREYQFRFLVDGKWHNDWHADKYVSNPYFGDNSVVSTHPVPEAK